MGASKKGAASGWRRAGRCFGLMGGSLLKRIDFAGQIGLEIRMQGEVAERLKAPDWKSCIQLNLYRGFESLSLRHNIHRFFVTGIRTRDPHETTRGFD